jgi:nitroreductase
MRPKALNELIRKRRAVFPPMYNGKKIPKKIIEQILENANYAPTHKLTEPWRFKILRGSALQKMSTFLIEDYEKNTPLEQQNEVKKKKMSENPLRSACCIAICMERHEGLPEWEELAAVAMAVQNMWLSCTAYGIGSYWSTPPVIGRTNKLLKLTDNEKCLGFFYMGYSDAPLPEGKRTPIADKVVWMGK